ncbi:WEB family protein At3g51220 [Abrus precatorius]|uniref:WEB family protein At3g51220 n=1 Tax=Abrus precatorius TaxID=3816 RepID=A0A8B8K2V6_ABRPR|nr:WEB family protein At3g51220 [Abrus precatorius]
MEPQSPTLNSTSTVDTSRPFSSVKEAVAIFGERLLLGEIYSSTPSPKPLRREASWRLSSSTSTPTPTATPTPTPPSPVKSRKEQEKGNSNSVLETIKKLEAELEETKVELKLLKERGSETEVALATLNAELHKNMSKLAQAEAAAAGKAAAATKTVRFDIGREEIVEVEKEKKNEYLRRMEDSGRLKLGEIISLGEKDHIFGGKKVRKQKPIIPLVGDLFFKRKGSSATNHHNPLYASPF